MLITVFLGYLSVRTPPSGPNITKGTQKKIINVATDSTELLSLSANQVEVIYTNPLPNVANKQLRKYQRNGWILNNATLCLK